jgi:hypothetical protein
VAANFYDAVILGTDLAATVAGALLAHRGLRVLVAAVPGARTSSAGELQPLERYSVGPYMLPRAPLAWVGLDGPVQRRLFGELGIVQLLRRKLELNRPSYQLLLPDARIDVGDELMRELTRELGAAALEALDPITAQIGEISTAVEAILAQDLVLPPDGFWDRRDAQRVAGRLPPADAPAGDPIGRLPADAPLRLLHEAPARFGVHVAAPSGTALARNADLHHRGSYRLDGGREALRTLLLERMKLHSGEVHAAHEVSRILVKRGKVTGVELTAPSGRREEVGATHVVCGMAASQVVALLDESEKPPKRLAESAAVGVEAHRYLLHFVAPLDALPDALGRYALSIAEPGAPLVGANALALHLADGYGQHAVLSVEALAPDPSPAGLASLRTAIRAHLDRLLPFVSEHLLCVHSPHDGIPPEGTGLGSATVPPPIPMDPIYAFDGPLLLGVCGVPHATGVKGLTLASRQVLPGLGLEGELAAGWTAARLIAGGEKKKGAALG